MSEPSLSAYLAALAEADLPEGDIPKVNSAYALIKGLAGLALERGDGPTLLRSQPPRPGLLPLLRSEGLERLLPELSRAQCLILSASLLQIHEFWVASHDAAQLAEEAGELQFSAYWHGIAHRREPDAGNASYWFRRVGKHPAFERVRSMAGPILEEHRSMPRVARLTRSSEWDAGAMIELCTRPDGPVEADVARSVQRIELTVLTAATIEAVL